MLALAMVDQTVPWVVRAQPQQQPQQQPQWQAPQPGDVRLLGRA
ncbi:MAG: hypothetical protein ACKN89_03335 [Cyanobium sp.]